MQIECGHYGVMTIHDIGDTILVYVCARQEGGAVLLCRYIIPPRSLHRRLLW